MENNNGSNGNRDMPSGAVLSWKPGSGGDARELLTVDKDKKLDYMVPEVGLKTVLRDDDETLDFAQAIHHCVRYHMNDMLKEIYTLMSLRPAVDGLARMQFLSGITGIIWDFKSKKPIMDQYGNQRNQKGRDYKGNQ